MPVNRFTIEKERAMTKDHREHINEYVPHDEEDVEGHHWKDRLRPPVDGTEEDVAGHFQPRGPWDPDQIER